jgi:SsrA-binding protein
MTPSDPAQRAAAQKQLATNRKALRDYIILDKIEAGIELLGAEVKSIRDGRVSLNESFADIEKGQVYLRDLNVLAYAHSRVDEHDPVRPKRLLLHKSEINRLLGQVSIKGHTIIPLRLYLKHGRVKVELALAKGKHFEDKRETIKRKTADRETAREIANRGKGK